jgi:aspartokinase-like uncharacterized kinase
VVIVPGGGRFADQVREHQTHWRFDDLTGHNMAILAMMQSAMMYRSLAEGLQPATTSADMPACWAAARCRLVSSRLDPREADDMTQLGRYLDSLAGWLASRLDARSLVLVKSCEIQPGMNLARQQSEA